MAIRRVIYTTNAIESLNRSFRKIIKTKAIFPDEESVFKLLYLSMKNIIEKWNRPIRLSEIGLPLHHILPFFFPNVSLFNFPLYTKFRSLSQGKLAMLY